MARFSLNIKTCCLYLIWESKIKFGQKFSHPKNYELPYTYVRKYTLCATEWVNDMQVCLEDMCNFPQFTILSISYL